MLSIRGLVVGYDKPLTRPVNLEVAAGEAVALYGPNGIGKTTFLKTVATLLKPLSGSVYLDGAPAAKMRRYIFYLPETVDLPERAEASLYVDVVAGFYEKAMDAREALRAVGVDPSAKIGKLSAGLKRRVQLAAALAISQSVKLMCLDDPFALLDPQSARDILNMFLGRSNVLLIASRRPLEGVKNIDFLSLK